MEVKENDLPINLAIALKLILIYYISIYLFIIPITFGIGFAPGLIGLSLNPVSEIPALSSSRPFAEK
jgi:hypothetical protein